MDGAAKPRSSRTTKIDPSFKSKRYRDKLRTEIKGLEGLIPLDRSSLHRKIDSQTVFRLIISYFRIKMVFKAIGIQQKHLQTLTNKEDQQSSLVDKQVDDKLILQCLDGFLLAAFSDGTIVYSTENVLQYLGFNQVDLMHRCLYGLVHPEDHQDLKHILENNKMKGKQKHYRPSWRQVSFICRMKCFNGTSAGYLKIHCSGSIQTASDSVLNKPSPEVILLYCQPFMLTGSDIVEDFKQNVFWSKHDMALTIKEFDKKSEEILGLTDNELKEKSFYHFVHPEDLATFAACHKTLTESTEVQTMYFRMETRDGSWVWLHSRGKVICKNSKKFSIVFTHCPVREEDSTFLQQESSLRQRYAMNDLLYFIQFGSPYAPCPDDIDDSLSDDLQGPAKMSSFCTPHMGFTEDLSMNFYNSLDPCPSSWHSMSDRHSPVLPSTHVAHKITQREKQIQFQEFKRRQQMYAQTQFPQFNINVPSFRAPLSQPNYYDQIPQEVCQPDIYGVNIKSEPVSDTPQPCHSSMWNDQRHCHGNVGGFSYPMHPSFYHQNQINTNIYQQPVVPNGTVYYPQYQSSNLYLNPGMPFNGPNQSFNINDAKSQNYEWLKQESSHGGDTATPQPTKRSSKRASIKVSMNCDYTGPPQVGTKYTGTSIPPGVCTQSNGNVVHYDIEASVHMKIVENSCRDNACSRFTGKTHDVDLPSIGSLFEFLNEGQF